MTGNRMRAVLLTGHGGYECLSVRDDLPVPVAGAGEVLIRIAAAAVNNTDVNTRLGWYSGGGWAGSFQFPRIQGIDACGVVAEVGAEVSPLLLGRRVLIEPCWRAPHEPLASARFFGSEVDGAFAQYAVVPERHVHPIESPLTEIELASFPCSYSTAENMLVRAGVSATDRVLVTGASGGVGSAAVELAVGRSASVTALAGSAKQAAVRTLGATEVVDRDCDLIATFGTAAFDVVIDVVGGPSWASLVSALRPGGRYVAAGAIAGPDVSLDLRTLYLNDITMFGCTVLGEGVFDGLVRRIEQGEVKPLVAAEFALDQIVEAQKLFLTKHHIGKIVLRVD
ncbi:MAG: zinc-binding dehydrogenase [Ilumatobacteraceae bacterium]|nr:zinc-binding dehydrogenase [Ilumatobacteraceae bacterium]